MREVISNIFKRSTLTFMSAVLALSSLAPLASAQTANAQDLAFGYKSELRLSSPTPAPAEAGTGTTSFSVKEVIKSPYSGGWTDVLTGSHAATITATADSGEVSDCTGAWGTTATVTTPASSWGNIHNVAAQFCYKGNVVGDHNISLTSNIPYSIFGFNYTISDPLTVPVKVVDTIKPVFEILSPSSGDVIGGGIVNTQVKVTEEGSGLDLGNTWVSFYDEATFGTPGQIQTESKNLTPTATPGVYTAAIDTTGHDGTYRLGVNGRDNAGNSRSAAETNITIDNTIPTFALTDDGNPRTAILDGTTINPTKLGDVDNNGNTIRFTKESVTDTLYVNDQPIFGHGYFNQGKSGQIGARFSTDGTYTVYTKDQVGNQSMSVTFTVDTTPPAVPVLLSPGNGAVVKGDNLVNDWEDVADADHYIYRSFNVNSDGSCNLNSKRFSGVGYVFTDSETNSRDVSDLAFCWQVIAVDAVGNESSPSDLWKTIVDNTAPTAPKITKPTARQWFKTTPIATTWNAAMDTNGIDHYQIAYHYDNFHTFSGSTCVGEEINGVTLSGCRDENGLSRNHSPAGWEEGGVTVWVRAIDNAGNVSPWSKSVHYYYDHTNPTTNIVAPTGIVGNSFTVSGDAADNLSLNRVYVQLVNRQNNQRYGGTTIHLIGQGTGAHWSKTFDANALNLPDGDYAAHVAVVDMAGNTSSAGWTDNFTVDTTKPTVEITSPTLSLTNNNVEVKATVTDANLHHYWFQIKKNGSVIKSQTVQSSGITDKLLWTLTDDGVYTITVAARDSAGGTANSGNRSADVVKTVTIDKTAPAAPTGLNYETTLGKVLALGSATNEPTGLFDWDGPSDAVKYGLYVWNDNVSSPVYATGAPGHFASWFTDSQVPGDLSVWGESTQSVCITAVDAAGNESACSDTFSLTFDQTAPNTPVATYTGSGTQQVTLSTDDSSDEIYYTIDNSTETLYTGPFALTQGLGFSAVARDAAGNESAPLTASAPVITNESSITPTTSSLVLQWTTDEATTSRVIYDTVSHATLDDNDVNFGYAFSTVEDSNKVTNHSVLVTGLTAGTTYYFRTVSHGSPVAVSDEVNGTTSKIVPAGTNSDGVPVFQVTSDADNNDATTDGEDGEVLAAQDSSKNVAATNTIQKSADGTWNIFGIAWYWVLLALAALAAAWWLIAAWRRRRNEA